MPLHTLMNTTAGRHGRHLAAAAAMLFPAGLSAQSLSETPRAPLTYWTDTLDGGPAPTGDAVKNWTAASGAPYISIPSNWNPIVAPVLGDDMVFGTLKPGDYSVHQDTGLSLGNVTISRALSTEHVNFSGNLAALSFRVKKGIAAVTSPSLTVTAAGATNATSSIVVGDGVGASASLSLTGVTGKYYDARVGVNGSSGTLQLTGINTSLTPLSPYTTDSVFGGAADAANATILIDGATVQSWVITTGKKGSTRITNHAIVSSIPALSGTGQVQIGSPDASTVTFEVSNQANLRVSGEDGMILIGAGAGAVTTTNIQSGGLVVADLVVTGGESSNGSAASTNTINITGAGTTFTTTEAFGTNGGYRYSSNRRGSTTVNITAGGKLFTARYDSNAGDRDADSGAASTTTLNISGVGSLLRARTESGGLFVTSLGDRTTDVTNVSNGGKIDAYQTAIATGAGASSTLTLSGSSQIDTGLIEVARPFRAGPATTATVNVYEGSSIECTNLITSSALGAVTTINVRDGGSSIRGSGIASFGGVAGDPLGGGSTTFSLSGGANATFVALQAGGASASGAGTAYTGTQISLSSPGTRLNLTGSGGATPASTDLAANLVLSGNTATRSTLTVSNGASLNLVDNHANPNLDGSIAMATAANANATLIVDGPDSTVDAGKIILMSQTPTANAFTNASSTITVRNGGFLGVYEVPSDPASGNLQMAIRPSTGSSATLNIGGGTSTSDEDSVVAIDGTLFVGGSGDTTPVPGARSVVNVNNGALYAAAVAVYANSTVNVTGGDLATDNLLLLGGRVDMSSATPLAIELGAIRASNGGVLNIGKGGAVVYYSTENGSPTDIATVRQMIYNGSNGGAWNGANSITSSLLSVASPQMAIGYADIQAVQMSGLFDLSFTPSMQGVAVRYTLRGDTNLDGAVNFADLLAVAQNYGTSGKDWSQGDLNYNRTVNFDDLLAIAQNYGRSFLGDGSVATDIGLAGQFASDWALARLIVPEPASLAALLAGMSVFRRRRHN